MSENSEVCDFYRGKTIFLTGGTGFLGVCLIDKILRSIPDIGKVYLLMRPKKGKEISERLAEIAKNKIFEKLLETNTEDIFNKLVPIAGEIGVDNMGLSPADRSTLIENVDVVIHSAATLDFQQNLRPTVTINLLGTRAVMDLCKEMKKLKVMVHVSSAFVNSFRLSCDEILYPPPAEVEKVVQLATTLTDTALEALEANLLGNHPNTYTFTKHFAEHEVAKCSNDFPCTIVRPSMITAAWKEPIPGWTNSKNGPQGFLMGASRGIIRRLPIARDLICDYIPVDVVVNQLLIAGMEASRNGPSLSIYHCTSSTSNAFRWRLIDSQINTFIRKYPLKSAVWYPHLKFVSSIAMYKISSAFVHFIPAVFLDMITKLTGGRPILIRLHKNVNSSLNRLERFIFTEWKFNNPETMKLSQKLNEKDKSMFPIDVTPLKWDEYFVALHLGVRRYLNNETVKTLPAARKKNTILMILHLLLKGLLIFGMWYSVSCTLDITMKQAGWAMPLYYILLNLF